jgi:CDP-paratose 2-epimerase
MLEAISLCEEITGKKLNHSYDPSNRSGDHIWYISDVAKFQLHYPGWNYQYDLRAIVEEIYAAQEKRSSARNTPTDLASPVTKS